MKERPREIATSGISNWPDYAMLTSIVRWLPTGFPSPVDRGDADIVAGLVAVAFLILALAAVNYVNLATIRVVRRQREIAMRKVLGVSNARLALQFVVESLLVSDAGDGNSDSFSLVLPCLSSRKLMNRDMGSMLSLENVGTALSLGVALGLTTAVYPAWIAFGVRPSLMLMGRPDSESLGSKRLASSVVRIPGVCGDGARQFHPGDLLASAVRNQCISRASILPRSWFSTCRRGSRPQTKKPRGLIAALTQRPEVAGVAISNDAVGRSQESSSTEIKREGREAMTIDVKSVSANFFQHYNIRPVIGRLFDPSIDKEDDPVPIVINAIAARQLGFASLQQAVGQILLFRSMASGSPMLVTKRIVGIAPAIRFYSLREVPGAIAYELWSNSATLTVRASGSTADAERAVRTVWPQYFPNSVLEMKTAKEIYAANYADDARLARLLALSTAIALIIAAFGVYVLAADAVQRRTMEIALRKLFGTRRRDIGKLVARDIGTVILLSAVAALPLAALAIGRYLAAYTERTPLAFWALAIALMVSLATAAFAGARQAWIAMTLKPAVALRK